MSLADFDPEIAQSIIDETERENNTLEMIASENFVSPQVQEAQGSAILANVIMAAANMLMLLKALPLNGQKNYSLPNTPMFNPIPAPRPIWRFTIQFSNREILFSE